MLMDVSCIKCARPAVVHLTDVTTLPGGLREVSQIHLCMKHAAEAGLVNALPSEPAAPHSARPEDMDQLEIEAVISPDDLMEEDESDSSGDPIKPEEESPETVAGPQPAGKKKNAAASTARSALTCPHCGMTWEEFRRGGMLGCPLDYSLFESVLADVLDGLHEGRVNHIGKVPAAAQAGQAVLQARTLGLQTRLAEALAQEKYEEAARLRDELKQLS